MDQSLLIAFKSAVAELGVEADEDTIVHAHRLLLQKVYNARCNEFLRAINKLACIDKDKVVDSNVSLRDELKVYAIKKNSEI